MDRDAVVIGVAGAGIMGGGIAQVAATAGFRVVLYGRRPDSVEEAFRAMDRSLARLHAKGELSEKPENVLSRVTACNDLASLSVCSLVIEAIAEQMGAKSELLARLGALLGDGAVLATTTSTLSITALGEASGIPGRCIGMHFMNPTPVMEVVELVAGERTSMATISFAQEMTAALGKTCVNSKDRPGFVISRLLCVLVNEAFEMLRTGVAGAEEIDVAMTLAARHPMGPLALADMVGLDVITAALETLSTGIDANRYAPSPLLREHVAQGRLGRKSGQGVYHYPAQ